MGKATVDEVNKCAFDAWYPVLKGLTVASRIIPLPKDFVEYLLHDGPMFLPERTDPTREKYAVTEEMDSEEWSKLPDEHERALASLPKFEELEKEIEKRIVQLGGAVFPKLNWSAPRDAAWISRSGDLRCTTPGEVFLLLKSSEFITHDLTMAYSACEQVAQGGAPAALSHPPEGFKLVLRNWLNIDPSVEFRCFVSNKKLIAISQRDHTNFYDALPALKDDIFEQILEFHEELASRKLPLTSYVFDIYRENDSRIWLLDINPFSEVTDSLLFTWAELDALAEKAKRTPSELQLAPRPTPAVAQEVYITTHEVRGAAYVPPSSGGERSQTDNLNKSLLMAFLKHIEDGKAPSFDAPPGEEDETAFANANEELSEEKVSAEVLDSISKGAGAAFASDAELEALLSQHQDAVQEMKAKTREKLSLPFSFGFGPFASDAEVDRMLATSQGDGADAGASVHAPLPPPSLTESLNKSLLRSAMSHLDANHPSTSAFVAACREGDTLEESSAPDSVAAAEWDEPAVENSSASQDLAASGANQSSPLPDDFPCEFRIVESRGAIRSSPLAASAVPKELNEIDTQEDLLAIMNLLQKGQAPPSQESDSEGEEPLSQ